MAASQSEGLLKTNHNVLRTRRQTPKQRPVSIYNKYVTDGWLFEVLCMLVGIAAVITLCVILRRYDGRPVPQSNTVFGANVTLNTLVSILSTLAKAAFLCAVSECISQLKWSWYSKRQRPLQDLAVFDEASRGAWGGLRLLWKVNLRQIGSLGAFLIIGGLAVDPLSQQLVHYREQVVPGSAGSATLPAAVNWTSSTQDTSVFVGKFDLENQTPPPPLPMKGAIQNGLFSQNSVVLDLQPSCSTGNCTWPPYQSLAICARTANVTSSLKNKTITVSGGESDKEKISSNEWYLTQQDFLQDDSNNLCNISTITRRSQIVGTNKSDDGFGDNQTPGLPFSLDFGDSIAFQNSTRPIADSVIIYSTSTTPTIGISPRTFAAIEFVLEWCIQTFTTTFVNGVPSTYRNDSVQAFSKPDPGNPDAFLTATSPDDDGRTYMIDPVSHYSLQLYFRDLFQGTANLTTYTEASQTVTSDAIQALFQPLNIFGEKINGTDQVPGRGVGPSGLQQILDNIATGMTNMLRTNDNLTRAVSSATIQGTANSLQTFVQVQWGWISALVILMVGSLILFASAVISSLGHNTPKVWKSSTLPLLKALNKELHTDGMHGMGTTSTLEQWAGGIPVRLNPSATDEVGWQLIGGPRGDGHGAGDDRGGEAEEMRAM